MSLSILFFLIIISCKPNSEVVISSISTNENLIRDSIVQVDESNFREVIDSLDSIKVDSTKYIKPNLPVEPKMEIFESKSSIPEKPPLEILEEADIGASSVKQEKLEKDKLSDTLENKPIFETDKPLQLVNMHEDWDKLLQLYVDKEGKVDYDGFLEASKSLDAYLQKLSSTKVSGLDIKAQMAFWINAYNAFTIKLILDHYPVNSIMDIAEGKIWDRKWIRINNKMYSLNNIEKDELLKKFKEPRIHFAVNCAAASCPPLANKAWTGENLNSLLEERTKQFLSNKKYNVIKKESIQLSMIFNWYGKDFGNLISFINNYSEVSLNENASVSFFEYDWTINQK